MHNLNAWHSWHQALSAFDDVCLTIDLYRFHRATRTYEHMAFHLIKNMCTYLVPNARVIVERLLVRGVCQGRADSRPGGLVYGCADPLHYVVAGRLAGTEICNLLAPCN